MITSLSITEGLFFLKNVRIAYENVRISCEITNFFLYNIIKTKNQEEQIMKKLLAMALVLVFALILFAACGGILDNIGGGGANINGKLRSGMAKSLASGTVHFKMRSVSEGGEMIYELYMKNGMTAATMDMNGMVTRSITKDGMAYSLYDNYKKYSVTELYDDTNIFAEMLTEGTDTYTLVGEGSMDFMGKKYKYEEFAEEDSDSRVFYFFDNKGVPVGMRSIEDGETQEIEILAFDQNIPNNVFDLPSDYTEASYDELMDILSDMYSYGGDDWGDWGDWDDWDDFDWD